MSDRVDAVVLAGGRTKGALLERTRQPYTALVRVAGRPMLEYVLEALGAAERVNRAVVVGPSECRPIVTDMGLGFDWMPTGESLVENLLAGAAGLGVGSDVILVAAADAPLLRPQTLNALVDEALRRQHGFVYPIVERREVEKEYPGTKRTYVRLREGLFTGGNVLAVSRRLLFENEERVAEVFAARKAPLRLASMLGPGLTLRLLLGRASIAQAEQRAERILGFAVSAYVCNEPGVGVDVDKIEDLELVESALSVRARV